MRSETAFAHVEVGHGPELGILREVADDGACELREITGCGHLGVGRQPVWIDESGSRHAKPPSGGIHALDEAVHVAADRLGQHHSNVVGRFDDQGFQRQLNGDLGANGQPNLARWLLCSNLGVDNLVVELELAFADRLEGDVGRHDLGERGRVPEVVDVLGIKDLA